MTTPGRYRESRLRTLDAGELDDEQRAYVEPMLKRSRGGLSGPINILARSPRFADSMGALGEFTRLESGGIEPRFQELAILITARFWSADYEWWVHVPKAVGLGIAPTAIEDIRAGRPPRDLKPDERALHDFLHTLLRDRKVTDEVYERAVAVLGEVALIHLIGFSGHYGTLAMILNATETHTPVVPEKPLEALDG